uniref:Uncharacterized protein n=1 Tax=Rhizophora mucronata TaxID=61149 RepID=A0A2P2KAV0_RHIMU
MRRVYWFRD